MSSQSQSLSDHGDAVPASLSSSTPWSAAAGAPPAQQEQHEREGMSSSHAWAVGTSPPSPRFVDADESDTRTIGARDDDDDEPWGSEREGEGDLTQRFDNVIRRAVNGDIGSGMLATEEAGAEDEEAGARERARRKALKGKGRAVEPFEGEAGIDAFGMPSTPSEARRRRGERTLSHRSTSTAATDEVADETAELTPAEGEAQVEAVDEEEENRIAQVRHERLYASARTRG